MIYSHSLLYDINSTSPFTMRNHTFADKLANFTFNTQTKEISTTCIVTAAKAAINSNIGMQYKESFSDLKIFTSYYNDLGFIMGNVPYKDDTLLLKLINRLEMLLLLEEEGAIYFKVKEDFITPYQITSVY